VADPDPIGAGSHGPQRNDLVVEVTGGKLERLTDVVGFRLGIFLREFRAIRVAGDDFDYAVYGEAHAPDAGLSVHQFGIDGNAMFMLQGSVTIQAPSAFHHRDTAGQAHIKVPFAN